MLLAGPSKTAGYCSLRSLAATFEGPCSRTRSFNLVHDGGTSFGLQTAARIESVLMSLPSLAAWDDAPGKPGGPAGRYAGAAGVGGVSSTDRGLRTGGWHDGQSISGARGAEAGPRASRAGRGDECRRTVAGAAPDGTGGARPVRRRRVSRGPGGGGGGPSAPSRRGAPRRARPRRCRPDVHRGKAEDRLRRDPAA
ncbi:MAG: coproporphyrinogen III oxidase [Gemmatimonadetes bacterium]|nr:coproporphyrinogen III oxidase [Gemmatimonadota bacterium]